MAEGSLIVQKAEKRAWIEAKIQQCRYIFDRRVRDGKMSSEEAEKEMSVMKSIAEDYREWPDVRD